MPASIKTACEAIRPHGTVVNVATWEGDVPFAPNALVFREGRYVGVLGYQKKDYVAVVDALGKGTLIVSILPQNPCFCWAMTTCFGREYSTDI